MKLADFNKLKKFMNLTFSDVDAEALAALRQANKVLKREGLDWDRVMNKLVTIDGPAIEEAPQDRAPTRSEYEKSIELKFEAVRETARDSFKEFIDSLYDQWEKRHYLTPGQYDALTKAAARAHGKGRR